jgi:hypothetical protein
MQKQVTLPVMLLLSAAMAGCVVGNDNNSNNEVSPSTLAVIGDMPYGANNADTAEFTKHPAFISAINADADVSMVLHAGDIHSGKQYCTVDYDVSIFSQWSAFQDPLVYTPGDNEWTDCHKVKEGGGTYNAGTGAIDYVLDANNNPVDYASGDPVANLDLVRSIFFSMPGTTIGKAMDVHTQAREYDPAHPTDSRYVENVWYEKSGVLFMTLNIPGGSNNDTDPWYGTSAMSPSQAQEVANRSAAVLRWINAAFAKAQANGDTAVVILEQADMWDLDGKLPAANHLSEYKPFIDSIASNATTFGKPVLLINGDSHFYRTDNPLVNDAACAMESDSDADTTTVACAASTKLVGLSLPDAYDTQPHGYNVANFHRIVVHGNATVSGTPMEWIKLKIDPKANAAASATAFGPFTWQRMQPTLP